MNPSTTNEKNPTANGGGYFQQEQQITKVFEEDKKKTDSGWRYLKLAFPFGSVNLGFSYPINGCCCCCFFFSFFSFSFVCITKYGKNVVNVVNETVETRRG